MKLTNKIAWMANTLAFLSSFITAIGYPFYGFIAAFFACLAFMSYGFKTKEHSFTFFNIFYFINAIYGIINWYGR